ncbi:phosphate/phosphite/phosphonate ABC transporter substrate-binding protein [Desulfobacula sp.]|uniref:substrate-binding domain-containing protein n=1 Tax=Desulfobacula sp. TaxID=2593537 RepID=UPI001ED2FB5B|nr:phosphate/phosphite/phosphonate ABC transporter substrate-binding protein [Desulfobacula sp.]
MLNKSKNKLILFIFFLSVLLVSGCEQNTDHKYVDFSEKIKTSPQDPFPEKTKTLRVAVSAMVSPKETYVYYEELLKFIGKQIGYKIVLIQRKTYSEVNELFPKRLIELAFVCSGPYVAGKQKYEFEGLAVPVVRGKPFYQSYLIVQKNSSYNSLEDLRGKIFAFTDPNSNTGNLVPRYWLSQLNEIPSSFFDRTTYTYSHDNSILAVAKGLVDGAAIDGHKWEFFNAKNPYFTSKTRVIKKSDYYGSPPLVASSMLDVKLKLKIQEAILTMHNTLEGKTILENLMVDRFELIQDEWYTKIQTMYEKVR